MTFATNRLVIAAVLFGGAAVASTTEEIGFAGLVAGHNLYVSASTSTESSFDDQWTRMVRISRSEQRIFSDPFANSIWYEAQRDASQALAVLARIAQIDNRKPSDWDLVVSGFKAATEDTKDQDRKEWGQDIWVRLLMEAGKSNLQKEYRAAVSTVDAKLAELAGTSHVTGVSNVIGVTYLPSWQGAYDNDVLVLTNRTGRDLSSLAVFVTIRGKNGTVITHLHRASRWTSNQDVHFRYPYYRTDYSSGETLSDPVQVEVSAFSTDGLFQGAYFRDADSWNATVRHYLGDVKVSGTFLGEYVEDGSNKLYYPGFKFSMAGLRRLPVQRIGIRFTRRGETKVVYWDWNKYLAADEEVALRSVSFAQFGKNDPPDRKEIILEFTDSPVPAVYSW